jgi:hypothetical protein
MPHFKMGDRRNDGAHTCNSRRSEPQVVSSSGRSDRELMDVEWREKTKIKIKALEEPEE